MILLLLAGCVQTVRFPPDLFPDDWDTGFVDDAIRSGVDEWTLAFGCFVTSDYQLEGEMQTDGWAGSASVAMVSPDGSRSEIHPMWRTQSDPAGRWDVYQLGPLTHASPEVMPGSTTTFDCYADVSNLSWAVWTTDRSGDPADCVVWGTNPAAVLEALLAEDPAIPPLCRDLGTAP